MERKKNKLKEIISKGEVALGTCVYSFSPAVIELAGFAASISVESTTSMPGVRMKAPRICSREHP